MSSGASSPCSTSGASPGRRERGGVVSVPIAATRMRSCSRSRDSSPLRPPVQGDSADEECGICFELLTERGGAVPLPCTCRVSYCPPCWDRALASSMSACDRALCPSCRTPMHVDFDAVGGRLLFSQCVPSTSSRQGGALPKDDWRKRLYAQALPLQIQLLRSYGAAHTAGLPPGDGEGDSAPNCVCGAHLRRITVHDRLLAFLSEEVVALPTPSVIERLMLNPPIVCDICSHRVDRDGWVWTCEHGRRTVLHAVSYDVCEAAASTAGGAVGSTMRCGAVWNEDASEGCFSYHAFPEERRRNTCGDSAAEVGGSSLESIGDSETEEFENDE